jgi:hypothetical protein
MKRLLFCAALAGAGLAAALGGALAQTQSAPIQGGELPGPAPGKWRMTITAMGSALPPQEQCIDRQMTMAEAEQRQQQAGVTCSERSYTRTPTGGTAHAICTISSMTVTSDYVITGDMRTGYRMEGVSRMNPAPAGMSEVRTVITAERIGDC